MKPTIILLLCISCICSFGQYENQTDAEKAFPHHILYFHPYTDYVLRLDREGHEINGYYDTIPPFEQVKLHNENEGLLYQCDSCPQSNTIIGIQTQSHPLLKRNTAIGVKSYENTCNCFEGNIIIGHDAEGVKDVPRFDTIQIIMLVCDTNITAYPRIFYSGSGSLQGIVYWIKGYAVFEKHNSVEGQVIYNTKDFYEYKIFKEYLDENKRKLSQNIIVWQSK